MFLLSIGSIILIIVVCLLVIFVVMTINIYNSLVKLRNKVRNSWSQIDVQLKRRFDMIPNLVETVKGYATHEKEIWDAFAEARGSYTKASKSDDIEGMAQANQNLGTALSRLLIVQEKYPELQANSNFQTMMGDIKDTENKIQYARQFYNDIVQTYNDKCETFPSNIFAKMFNFQLSKFFEIANEEQREAPQVKF